MLIIDFVLLIVLGICICTDLRSQKIYNAVLLPAFIFAAGYYLLTAGGPGILFSLKGALVGLMLFLMPYLLGGIGAGDVKLLAIVGALKGTEFVFYSFILTSIIGGIIALLVLLTKGRLLKVLRDLGTAVKLALLSHLTVWRLPSLNDGNNQSQSFPYGVAIAVGSVISFAVM